MKRGIIVVFVLALFLLVGCVQEPLIDSQSIEDVTEEDLEQLPSDLQPQEVEKTALTGQANKWYDCQDPDSISTFDKNSLLTKSITTYNGGSKTDRCYTWYKGTLKEKTRLIEGICRQTNAGPKFNYWYADCNQKFGEDYKCVEDACVKEIPTFDFILVEEIPQEWIVKFNDDFKIKFSAYVPIIEYPDGTLEWDEDNKVSFNTEEKNLLKEAFMKAVYSMSRVDSYFTKPLPWTNGQSYYDWLKDSAGTITFSADINSLDNSNLINKVSFNGYNIISNINQGMLNTWKNQDLNSPDLGQGIINLIQIITHEVRHNNGVSHASCKGGNNMDDNLEIMGGHGVNVMLPHWMKYLLPEEMVQSAYDGNIDLMFQYFNFLDRMCSLDPVAKTIKQEDLSWVEEVSGFPLDFDPDILWTIEFTN